VNGARGAAPADQVTFRRLVPADAARFAALAAMSDLCSIGDDARRHRLLRQGVVITALGRAGDVIGCCCIEPCTTLDYVHRSGRIVSLPLPNAYLCGSFVHPAHRGRGIGTMLYAKRLGIVEASHVEFVALEILGSGAAYSVSPGARPGISFHLRAGFTVDGYSLDEDRGPVLVRRASRNAGPRGSASHGLDRPDRGTAHALAGALDTERRSGMTECDNTHTMVL
jgi:GNAT superfamily N-acetyltransferase